METPVLIPARNEADNIGSVIGALNQQREAVLPIVIANGCSDATSEIAAQAGAVVVESQEGRIAALQAGLRSLGERALKPLLIIDADSAPISRNWSKRMVVAVQSLSEDSPAVGWGPMAFRHSRAPISAMARTVRSTQILYADRHKADHRCTHGANMVLRIQSEGVLQSILGLENYWPGSDVAIHDAIIAAGGIKKHILHPQAFISTDGSRFPSIWQRLRFGHEGVVAQMDESYGRDATPETVVYMPR